MTDLVVSVLAMDLDKPEGESAVSVNVLLGDESLTIYVYRGKARWHLDQCTEDYWGLQNFLPPADIERVLRTLIDRAIAKAIEADRAKRGCPDPVIIRTIHP